MELIDKPITEEDYEKMSLLEIANYFTNYKVLKAFCRSLKKEMSSDFITLTNNEDVITKENEQLIKETLLKFMKLPDSIGTQKSKKQDAEKYKSKALNYSKFRVRKYSQLMISFVIIKRKLYE